MTENITSSEIIDVDNNKKLNRTIKENEQKLIDKENFDDIDSLCVKSTKTDDSRTD